MTLVLVVIVWALILGFSPGLALIALAVGVLVLDRYDARILDSLLKVRLTR